MRNNLLWTVSVYVINFLSVLLNFFFALSQYDCYAPGFVIKLCEFIKCLVPCTIDSLRCKILFKKPGQINIIMDNYQIIIHRLPVFLDFFKNTYNFFLINFHQKL